MQAEARRGKQRLERQFACAIDVIGKKARQFQPGEFFGQLLEILLAQPLAGLPVTLPERTHQGVERHPVRCFLPQYQVKRECRQCALGVIADNGIGRVFVGPVKLAPGVKAGFGD